MVFTSKEGFVTFSRTLMCFMLMSQLQGTVISFNHSWSQKIHFSVDITNESRHFLDMIFKEFGSNATGNMNVEQFQSLLRKLQIDNKETISNVEKPEHNDVHKRDNHVHDEKENGDVPTSTAKHIRNAENASGEKKKNNSRKKHGDHLKCLGNTRLLNIYNISRKRGVTESDFIQLCPAMIYQIASGLCSHVIHVNPSSTEQALVKVWGYGLLSITIISLSSLLVIAVIPLIGQSVYYKLMSFLVALAIGTLSGDAMFHLIPHAFLKPSRELHTHENQHHQQSEAIWKSCVVMVGIYMFFMVETLMKMRGGGHSHTHAHSSKVTQEADKDATTKKENKPAKKSLKRCLLYSQNNVGPRLAGARSRNSGYFGNLLNKKNFEECDQEYSSIVSLNLETAEANCMLLNHVHPNNDATENYNECARTLTKDAESQDYSNLSDNKKLIPSCEQNGHSHQGGEKNINDNTSIASVAWMVIVSDGFHNFSDGLAVGAAFSTSLATGLTTALAVFCHEIPHELGDFAILVKSGLTIKQAIAYNMASAVISYIGLISGILIGNLDSAHGWVLALTAGMFLYVSLVDMLPELSNLIAEGADGLTLFICQTSGMLFGIIAMLTIALLESH